MNDSVSAMKFGKFGREDNALVLVTIGGALTVKILKRTAHFDKNETAKSSVTAAQVRISFNNSLQVGKVKSMKVSLK